MEGASTLSLKCTASVAQHTQECGERGLPETLLLLLILFMLKFKTVRDTSSSRNVKENSPDHCGK